MATPSERLWLGFFRGKKPEPFLRFGNLLARSVSSSGPLARLIGLTANSAEAQIRPPRWRLPRSSGGPKAEPWAIPNRGPRFGNVLARDPHYGGYATSVRMPKAFGLGRFCLTSEGLPLGNPERGVLSRGAFGPSRSEPKSLRDLGNYVSRARGPRRGPRARDPPGVLRTPYGCPRGLKPSWAFTSRGEGPRRGPSTRDPRSWDPSGPTRSGAQIPKGIWAFNLYGVPVGGPVLTDPMGLKAHRMPNIS